MPKIRLLFRHPNAPSDVDLGEVCEVDDQLAADLIADGSAEALPDEESGMSDGEKPDPETE